MSIDIDVRETKSYTDIWDPDEDQYHDRRIRFRVTKEHYLCYIACMGKSKLTIRINPLPTIEGVEELDYKVILVHEEFTHTDLYQMRSTVATCSKTKVLETNINQVTKIDMKFVIINPIQDLNIDQTITVRKSWYDTIQVHMNKDVVTLIGSDGEVMVNKMFLSAHSTEFEATFSWPMSAENQTNRMLMEDYTLATLKSMAHFLESHGLMVDGNKTACDLLLLADRYGIKELKSRAEKFLMENVDRENSRTVFRTFIKVKSDLLEELFELCARGMK